MFKLLPAALLAALALGQASAFAADKMMGKEMMPDKMMADKMMAGMSKSDKKMMTSVMMMRAGEVRVPMMTSPPAANAGLQDATGLADVNVAGGMVEIVVTLPDGKTLPAGSVLEGWLSSAGRKGGPGPSTASDADQKFGPAFGMAELSNEARDVPYALSTGILRRVGNTQTYFGRFQIDNRSDALCGGRGHRRERWQRRHLRSASRQSADGGHDRRRHDDGQRRQNDGAAFDDDDV